MVTWPGNEGIGHHQASASRSEVSATSTQTSATGQAPPSLHDSGPNAPYALAADTAQKPALIFDNLPLPALTVCGNLAATNEISDYSQQHLAIFSGPPTKAHRQPVHPFISGARTAVSVHL